MALAYVASLGVGIAVVVAMWTTVYSWWESLLVGLFCGFPVFLLGAWWAARAED